MADLGQPSPTKKRLPFKRTVRRKSSEVADDDGLSLFSRSGEFFEEQQRLAKEKVEKEKAKEARKAARAAAKEQELRERTARAYRVERIDQDTFSRDRQSPKKRRRTSFPDDDNENKDSDNDDIFGYKSAKKQASSSAPYTPDSKRESSLVASTRGSGEQSARSRTRSANADVIPLDDVDDDPVTIKSPSGPPPAKRSDDKAKQDIITLDDDESDHQADVVEKQKEDKEEDPSEYYIRQARERMRKAKEEREAREREGSTIGDDDPIVKILIHPNLQGMHTLMFRLKLSQKLTVVYQTWIEQQVAKHSPVPRSMLETMFFTWKGNKVYPHTTLQTLGIKPERDGTLYPSWKTGQEGYDGRDKVYFEAWTQELYDDYLREKERQRLLDLGELIDTELDQIREPEQSQASPEEQKIRILFKTKNQPPAKATVRSSTTATQLVKLYRRLANIPENKAIELHWDGEVLEPDTTVEEADIGDMDSLEVHIK